MAKFLTDSVLIPLQQKAAAYDTVCQAILASNDELKADDITAELIVQALTSNTSSPDIQSKLDSLQASYSTLHTKYATLENKNTELNQENQNLRNTPGEEPAAVTSKNEVGSKPTDIADFATDHAGDTLAILNQAIQEGLILTT